MEDIRVAAVVCRSLVGDTEGNLARMAEWIQRAAERSAAVAVFPEMNITGYAAADGHEIAEPIPGPATDRVRGWAREHQLVILAGLAESDPTGPIFASHFVAFPDGSWDVYRKLHIGPPEMRRFTAGNAAPLFSAAGATFGIQLCYDAHFPELTTLMALDGADIVFMPHASPRGTPREKFDSWMRHLTARAFDNGIFVIAVNPVGKNGRGLLFPGVAAAIGPDGQVMDRLLCEADDMLVVDLPGAALAAVRGHRMRYFLPNRRPELLKRLSGAMPPSQD